ncbi:hypothetical protein BH10PSE19_BH10PSE19_17450 [soil metagenome]
MKLIEKSIGTILANQSALWYVGIGAMVLLTLSGCKGPG